LEEYGARIGGVWSQKLYAHCTQEFFLCPGRVVVAIPDHDAACTFDDLRQHRELVGVGRSHGEAGDHPWPTDPYVYAEAVESLLEQSILAESRLYPKARAAVSAGEQTRRQGHRVNEGEGGVVGSEAEKLLPEVFFDLPEVGSLPREGGAMHLLESAEPLCVVPSEEEVDALVGVEAEELSDYLDGEDFRVGELGRRTALANATIFEPIVDEAEDGHDEGAKIHKKASIPFGAIGLTPSVRGSSPSLKSSKKRAHGVT
jgi:hypothetical protein